MRSLLSAFAWILLVSMVDIGTAPAQQTDRVYKIGWLWLGRPGLVQVPMEKWTGSPGAAFRDALRDSGYVLGKNFIVDVRHGHGEVARLAAAASSLVSSDVDLIVTVGTAPTIAAMQATRRIPIVFVGAHDPVGKGLVASLANPGGNVTGMAVQVAGPKIYQLLRDIAPAIRRAGLLNYWPNVPEQYRETGRTNSKAAAAAIGVELIPLRVTDRDELEPKLAELAGAGDGGLIISSDATLLQWSAYILATALRHQLVTVCDELEWVAAGCLITYAEDPYVRLRRAAGLVNKILKGTRPADIPVEEPTTFKLVINARTAKALDLAVPPSLLAIADEVIE